MEIKTIKEIINGEKQHLIDTDGNVIDDSSIPILQKKWVAVDELNKLIDKSDCFGSPRARAEFNKLVNSQSNENKKED